MRYQRTNSIADAADESSRHFPTLTSNSMSIRLENHKKWANNYFVDVWHLNKEKSQRSGWLDSFIRFVTKLPQKHSN